MPILFLWIDCDGQLNPRKKEIEKCQCYMINRHTTQSLSQDVSSTLEQCYFNSLYLLTKGNILLEDYSQIRLLQKDISWQNSNY